MEKSSLNIKSFRNLLSNQNKNYKISPNAFHPTEVKLNGITTGIDDPSNSQNVENIYSIKTNKKDAQNESDCNQKRLTDAVCGNVVKYVGNYNTSFCLTVLTPVACSVSVIIIVAAIAGPLWITTEEKIPWLAVNTSHYRSNYTVSYIIKSSNASLWILCTRQALDDNRTKLDFTHKNCSKINYFSMEKYQPDPRDSTNELNNVIPYTITLSAPLLIISFIILLISYLLFLLAICSQKYKIFYFVAGIGFIISGLVSLSGLIMFISIFKAEVFHKLHPTSHDEPLYTFAYGHSFMLYVIGFVVVELAGILNVCLFNQLQQISLSNQNHFHLNNHVKKGPTESEASASANMCQHGVRLPSIVGNGYLPQHQRHCSVHAIHPNMKSMGDGFNNLLPQQVPRFDEFNHRIPSTSFRRNASTSTLDLVGDDGDDVSGKNNQRAINITKDKSVNNKMDFNNICGMMRSSLSKSRDINESKENVHRLGRLKPAKNVYFIEEPDEEPNIFIIDPSTVNRHKKFHQLQKSLEDIRLNKINNKQTDSTCNNECDATIGWNFMDRNYYGSRTLPRDFARRNVRPSLDNLVGDISSDVNRSDLSGYHRCVNHTTLYPPPIGFSFHHNSCDELSSHKHQKACGHVVSFHEPSKASQEYQWPKVIPKSPSSFSMNSFRLQRHPPTFDGKCQNHNWLDDIESERRRSQASLFKETVNKTDFGTAV